MGSLNVSTVEKSSFLSALTTLGASKVVSNNVPKTRPLEVSSYCLRVELIERRPETERYRQVGLEGLFRCMTGCEINLTSHKVSENCRSAVLTPYFDRGNEFSGMP